MSYEQIIYQPGPVARLIMDRPEYRNAQSRVMIEEIDDAFQKAAWDPEVKVIVFSGNGPCFSAGHDLGSPPEMADRERRGFPQDRHGRYARSYDLFVEKTLRWRNLPKPTIAMVHGYCIYGGYMFAAAMDLLFAADDALFLPSQLQYFTAGWDLGAKKAKEIMFENRFIPAAEALTLGFVNRVYPRELLEPETLAYAAKVAENDALTLRMAKFAINQMLDAQGFQQNVNGAYHTHVAASYAFAAGGGSARDPAGRRRLGGVGAALRRLEADKTQYQEA